MKALQGNPRRWFSVCNLVLTQLEEICKKNGVTYPPPLFYQKLFRLEKKFDHILFWPKTFFLVKFFFNQIFILTQHKFWPSIFFWPNIFSRLKFCQTKFFSEQNFRQPNIFRPKIFSAQNFVNQKNSNHNWLCHNSKLT